MWARHERPGRPWEIRETAGVGVCGPVQSAGSLTLGSAVSLDRRAAGVCGSVSGASTSDSARSLAPRVARGPSDRLDHRASRSIVIEFASTRTRKPRMVITVSTGPYTANGRPVGRDAQGGVDASRDGGDQRQHAQPTGRHPGSQDPDAGDHQQDRGADVDQAVGAQGDVVERRGDVGVAGVGHEPLR